VSKQLRWLTVMVSTVAISASVGTSGADAQDGLLPPILSPQVCVPGQAGDNNQITGSQNNTCNQNSNNTASPDSSGGGGIISPQVCLPGQTGNNNQITGSQNNTCNQSSTNTAPPPAQHVAYSSIPQNLPGNVASLGYEATGTSEFGDEVGLATTGNLHSQEVVLSSWGCQTRDSGSCQTAPGATFTHPITMNLYAVNDSGPTPTPGAKLATQTQAVAIPYRPSADPVHCTGPDAGKWYSPADHTCYNGFATRLKFNFPNNIPLPNKVIWTVAFNTTHAGYNPIGENTPCFTSSAGCPYDSLNVGAQNFPGAPFAGTDIDPNGAFLNSSRPSSYCDNGAGGTGTLRLDTAPADCWSDNKPLATITTRH
jgi:hypothetical protein